MKLFQFSTLWVGNTDFLFQTSLRIPWKTQCGNSRIFLSLRFSVKSNVSKKAILTFLEILNLDLGKVHQTWFHEKILSDRKILKFSHCAKTHLQSWCWWCWWRCSFGKSFFFSWSKWSSCPITISIVKINVATKTKKTRLLLLALKPRSKEKAFIKKWYVDTLMPSNLQFAKYKCQVTMWK